jgi:hypothetical protein
MDSSLELEDRFKQLLFKELIVEWPKWQAQSVTTAVFPLLHQQKDLLTYLAGQKSSKNEVKA